MTKKKNPTNAELRTSLNDGSFFKQYEKMAYRIAHNMRAIHSNMSFEELIAEGYYGIAVHADRYDPTKGAKVSTWAYKIIWGHMKNLCIREAKRKEICRDFSTLTIQTDIEAPIKENWFANLIKELSEDASLLVKATCEAPGELDEVLRESAPKKSKKALNKYLTGTLGWDKTRINSAWKEVELCL